MLRTFPITLPGKSGKNYALIKSINALSLQMHAVCVNDNILHTFVVEFSNYSCIIYVIQKSVSLSKVNVLALADSKL